MIYQEICPWCSKPADARTPEVKKGMINVCMNCGGISEHGDEGDDLTPSSYETARKAWALTMSHFQSVINDFESVING